MHVTEGKVNDEQGVFRKGKGCVDKIFAIEIMVEKFLGKVKICMQPSKN